MWLVGWGWGKLLGDEKPQIPPWGLGVPKQRAVESMKLDVLSKFKAELQLKDPAPSCSCTSEESRM